MKLKPNEPEDMQLDVEAEKRIAGARERFEIAHKMVVDLCKPRNAEGHRDWMMSIPAKPDYDPDLVIGRALRDIPFLLEQLALLRRVSGKGAQVGTISSGMARYMSEVLKQPCGQIEIGGATPVPATPDKEKI